MKLFIKLAVVALSSILGLVFIETYLNYFDNYKGNPIRVVDGKTIDGRDTWRAIFDSRMEGKDTYRGIFSIWTIRKQKELGLGDAILPLGGISCVWTAFGNENDKYVIYLSDRFGFYNKDTIWDQEPKILLIGDSFAQGSYVEIDDTIASVMSNLYQTTVNIASSANGPFLNYASLREFGNYLKPKIILWMFAETNDLSDIPIETNEPAIMRYFEEDYTQNLISRQEEADAHLRYLINQDPEFQSILAAVKTGSNWSSIIRFRNIRGKINTLRKNKKVRDLTKNQKNIIKSAPVQDLNPLRQILTKADSECSNWGGQLIFIYTPQWERYHPGSNPNQQRSEVLNLVAELGIEMLDLHEIFNKMDDPLKFYNSREHATHFNESGYRRIAETIVDYLEKIHNR